MLLAGGGLLCENLLSCSLRERYNKLFARTAKRVAAAPAASFAVQSFGRLDATQTRGRHVRALQAPKRTPSSPLDVQQTEHGKKVCLVR